MGPLISVVIPTYNRARYLGEAIESVLCQTHKAFEIIVIDDGSTDESRAVAARYAPEARYVWQPNAERGAARNHGLRLAHGEFIGFLDSDDIWMPDKLERDLELFRQRPYVDFVYSDVRIIDADGRPLNYIRRRGFEGRVTRHLLSENFISIGAHLVRTEVMRKAGGFREERELAGSEDWEAWVRLSTQVQFAHVASATACIRVHPNNSMSNAAGMERSMRSACAVMAAAAYLTREQRQLLSYTHATVAFNSAINYCVAGERQRTWSLLLEAIRHSPGVVLDPRFGYTCMHNLLPSALSSRLRGLKKRIFVDHSSC